MENQNQRQNEPKQGGANSQDAASRSGQPQPNSNEAKRTTGSNPGMQSTTQTSAPKQANDQKGGQGGYDADTERRETTREQEQMKQERNQDDVNVDRQQTGSKPEQETRTGE